MTDGRNRAGLTPDGARILLRERAAAVIAEEREQPPVWSPYAATHPVREISSAAVAARSRAEHALRLVELPDADLSRMLNRGWHPRDCH